MKKALDRREFLKMAGAGAAAGALDACSVLRQDGGAQVPRPLPRQAAWQDFELGLLYHFDMHVYMPGGHEHERSRRAKLSPDLYNPKRLDTDQWLEAAKAAGARYAIFTATHHSGFLQWQSDIYPYGVKQAPWRDGKGDVVKDFVESCRKAGIQPGIYVGIRFNAHLEVYGYEVNGGKGGDEEKRARYMRICERMVEELCSRFGRLCEIWFDGGVIPPGQGGPDLLPIVDRHQPDIVFYHSPDRAHHRWAGSETGATAYPCYATMPSVASQTRGHKEDGEWLDLLKHGDPEGTVWCPPMSDAPLRNHDWVWRPDSEHKVQPLDRLVEMAYKSIGRNSNLILGAVADLDGRIPDGDLARFAGLGKELRRRFDNPLAEMRGRGDVIELKLEPTARINQVSVMEDVLEGERIREYVIEALIPGNEWMKVAEGSSIGHKRIQRFQAVEAARVRLRALKSIAAPRIRSLAVYEV